MDLYYYTTAETMRYILSGKNIYATNMMYMNDSQEFVNGLREVRNLLLHKDSPYKDAAKKKLTQEIYEKYLNSPVDSFSISFTTARDLLSQWSMYAKESGVSLKMVFEKKEYDFLAISGDTGEKLENYAMYPQMVYYFTKEVMDSVKYQKVGKEILDAMQAEYQRLGMMDIYDNIEALWLKMIPFVKRADFGAEEEYRLVFDFNNAKSFTPRVDFRNDKHVIKPYLDISLKEGWPITEVTVGPGFNQKSVYTSIIYYMCRGKIYVPMISIQEFSNRVVKFLEGMLEYGISLKTVKGLTAEWQKDCHILLTGICDNDKTGLSRIYERYNSFIEKKKKDIRKPEFKAYLNNNFLAPNGIQVGKSKIPYIY